MDLGATVRTAARRFGPRTVLVDHAGRRMSYQRLDRQSEAVARGLADRGVAAGDVVALSLQSTSEYLVAFAAAAKLGAVTAGINPRLAPREVSAVVATLDAAVVLSSPAEVDELARPGAELAPLAPDPDRPAVVAFTSGTTGKPKGALFLERQIDAITQLDTGGAWGHPGAAPVPMLSMAQFCHIGMMTKLSWYLRLGMRIHTLDRWSPSGALAAIAEHRIPGVGGVAPMISLMLAEPDFDRYDLSCVSTLIVGGALSPPGLISSARERFGAAYSNRYSSTESGGCGTAVPFDCTDEEEILFTAGRPRGPIEVNVRDDDRNVLPSGEQGEIWLRSPTQFVRYVNNPEATASVVIDGWVRTGDLGTLDAQGRLRPAGRSKDAFIRGGYNVVPGEVESAICQHPDIVEVAVVPRPDSVLGSIGVAVVVPREGVIAPDVKALREFLRDHLAGYKHPELVVSVDALPRTAMDKIDRAALEARVGELADR